MLTKEVSLEKVLSLRKRPPFFTKDKGTQAKHNIQKQNACRLASDFWNLETVPILNSPEKVTFLLSFPHL